MTSRQILTRSDLTLLGLSAICIAAAAVSSTVLVDVIVGLPLTAYLPGAILVSAFCPQGHLSSLVERQVWSIGASFGLSVLGGLVLNLVGGLTRSSWLIWIGVVVVTCVALKSVMARGSGRSDALPAGHPYVSSDFLAPHEGENSRSAVEPERNGAHKVSLRQGFLLIGAGVICVASFVLSEYTDVATTSESFVQAWVLPRPTEDVWSTSVQLGIRNHLGSRRTFLVDVNIGSEPREQFAVSLYDGASWTHLIHRNPGERIESIVYSLSQPQVILARVNLATPTS